MIGLRRRRRRLICPCGASTKGRYDTSRRRWRHLDFGACQVWLEADIHRIDCRTCGRVRTEQVPWARPHARHTTDFENVAAWLAQRMDKASIARLLRCSWEAVDAIVTRVVADHIDDARLDQLYRIGVDEISYKRGRKFLTIVADHETGNVVWVGKERSKAAFEDFFAALGPDRAAAVEAISLDGSSVFLPVTREQIPQARICLDPFHVIKWTNEVVESVYRTEAPTMPSGPGMPERRDWRRARFAVRAGRENLDDQHRQILRLLRRHRYRLWRTPGNSMNSYATSTAPPIPPTPAPTSNAGAPPRNAAGSPPSATWYAGSRNTPTPSLPPWNSACPTPASKASTPRSDSSNAAASATATSTPSPRPSTSASAESPSIYPQKPE
ncbi:MAG TPA: ISL3 family transposase [Micromonosporaceae bacterium]|nr:ISL3 family transposase [Micromonosporaceae bacterium]